MNYHNILHDDMRNGTGLRVTLFLSGCNHYCKNCQNPQTWDCTGGIEFDLAAEEEIFEQLKEDYISGITFSGGDPLYKSNLKGVLELCKKINANFPNKNIWLYTGYTWENLMKEFEEYKQTPFARNADEWLTRYEIISKCDVVIDGRYIESLSDIKYQWAGSTNQRVIDAKKSLEIGDIILWETNTNTH